MTTSTGRGDSRSGATLSCLTGAIARREGAGAVGSTFAREWDSEPAPPPPTSPPASSRGAAGVQPAPCSPAALPVLLPALAIARRSRSRHANARMGAPSLPWSPVGAFALGATLAAVAGEVLERGALEVAALASAVAAGITLAAALTRAPGKGCAVRRRQ